MTIKEHPVPARSTKNVLLLAAIVFTFTGLAIVIVSLARAGIITVSLAMLMLVGLLGIYFGLGILIAAHFLVSKLK